MTDGCGEESQACGQGGEDRGQEDRGQGQEGAQGADRHEDQEAQEVPQRPQVLEEDGLEKVPLTTPGPAGRGTGEGGARWWRNSTKSPAWPNCWGRSSRTWNGCSASNSTCCAARSARSWTRRRPRRRRW